jgi:phosphomannomutase
LINSIPDGAFAHHPEPVPENITKMSQIIKKRKADVGFIQDADADRLAIINEKGEPIGEEITLALAVKHILDKKRGPIVTNLSTTRAIDDIAGDYRVPVFRTKIGEINVVEEIIRKNAVIGGEGNGGVIFPEIHLCRDSFTAMGLTLESMAATGKTVSQLQKEIPKYSIIKDKIDGSPEQAHQILKELRRKYSKIHETSTLDGLKIIFNNAWAHIRPSNTEPVIRILAEAKNLGKAETIVKQIKEEIKGLLKWKS